MELHTHEMQSNFSRITKLHVLELIFPPIYNASKQTLHSEFSPKLNHQKCASNTYTRFVICNLCVYLFHFEYEIIFSLID